MKANVKATLIIILLILIPTTIYVVYRLVQIKKLKDKTAADKEKNKQTTKYTNPDIEKLVTTNWTQILSATDEYGIDTTKFPLKQDDKTYSEDVKIVQRLINKRLDGEPMIPPYAAYDKNGKVIKELVEDGYYGYNTAAIVRFMWPDTSGNQITLDMFYELAGITNTTYKYVK